MRKFHDKGRTRRAHLALTTALGLSLGFYSTEAVAQSLPATPVVAGGSATFSSNSGAVDTVNLGGERTLIDWANFNVADGSTLNFNFGAGHDSWIVLNRTTGQAVIDGTMQGCLSNCTGDFGGNIWLYASGGVIFGPHAVVNAGGLLATTSPLSNTADFLDSSKTQFTFGASANNAAITLCGASCVINGSTVTGPGASLTGHAGLMAFAAQVVNQGQGSVISDADGTVLYGAARSYSLKLAKSADAGNWDMVDFVVGSTADGSGNTAPINILGKATAGNIYVGAVTQNGLSKALVKVNADVEATGASLSDGNIVLSAGGDIENGATHLINVSPVDLSVGGISGGHVSMSSTRDLAIVSDITASSWLDAHAGVNLQQFNATGKITTPNLTASGVNVYINHANAIGAVSDLTATGGTFTLTNTTDLALGNVSAGVIDLRETSGNLTLTGDINTGASQTKLVVSNGDIHQTGGSVTAGTLWAQAPGVTDMNSANHVGSVMTFGSTTDTGSAPATSLSFTNAQTLQVGDVKAQDVTLTTTAGDLKFAPVNFVVATHQLTVTSAGNVTQGATRTVTTARLTGSAAGDIVLQNANKIDTIDNLTANTINLVSAKNLTVGNINANAATIGVAYNLPTGSTDTGGMTLTGNLWGRDGTSPMSSLTLNAHVGYINESRTSGNIIQTDGTIQTDMVSGTADSIKLTQPPLIYEYNVYNKIGSLDNINANNVEIVSDADMTVGNINSNQVKLSSWNHNMTLTGRIIGENAVRPASIVILGGKSLNQTGGLIVTDSLQQLHFTGGDINLTSANQVGELNDITTENLNFVNAGPLTVKAIKANTLHLTTTTGDLTLTRNIVGKNGKDAAQIVILTANNGNIKQTGGVITANSLRQSYASGNVTLTGANQVGEFNDVTATNIDFVNAKSLSVKSIKATTVHLTTTAGDMVLHNNIWGKSGTTSADKVILTALNGNIDQQHGQIWTRSLQQLYASGYINITSARIAELNDVTATSFNFNTGGLDSTHSVKVYSLKADEMFLQGWTNYILTRNITARDGVSKAQKVTIWTQSGDITQTGGVIHAHQLDVQSLNGNGTVTLLPGNDVGP